jgi:hypothetical protein
MPELQRLTQEDLDALASEIAERFPRWRFVGSGAGTHVTAESVGTVFETQAASSPDKLLEVLAWREDLLERNNDKSVTTPVKSGLVREEE